MYSKIKNIYFIAKFIQLNIWKDVYCISSNKHRVSSGVTESKKRWCVETKKEQFLVRIYASFSSYKTFYFKWMFQRYHIIT